MAGQAGFRRVAVEHREVAELSEGEPFLLYESSQAFLDGDPRGMRERFQFRRDALDYIGMGFVVAGGLLLLVKALQLMHGPGEGDDTSATVAAIALAAVLTVGGAYYLTNRHGAAAARKRMIDEGRVLHGTVIECTARHETTTEAAFGEVARSYLVAVDYAFDMPEGDRIIDRAEHNRPDLRRAELPTAGSPVRVLYLDDRTHALL
jgi:hypothetical protein